MKVMAPPLSIAAYIPTWVVTAARAVNRHAQLYRAARPVPARPASTASPSLLSSSTALIVCSTSWLRN
jgi:hypothetical protein